MNLRTLVFLSVTLFALAVPCACADGIVPTHRHVKYGPHEANFLNVWIAPSDEPTPVLVKIHGGGWIGGQPEDKQESDFYLKNGVTVVSIGYRLTGEAILPAPVLDAARAVQFVRSMAEEWNIDKSRLALLGGSAGGCTSLWLALHDDLADPSSDDPVERESTKPLCAGATNAQSTIDPLTIREWFGHPVNHPMIWKAVGAPDLETAEKNYAAYEALYRKFSPVNFIDQGDAPIYLSYSQSSAVLPKDATEGIHHPIFGVNLKERADAVGLECILQTKDIPDTTHGGIHKFLVKRLHQGGKIQE
jgi:arylformamidase